MARVGLRLDAHWRLEAGLVQVDNRAGDPGDERLASPAVAPRYDTEATLLSSTLRHAHGDWQGELRLYRSRGEGNWLDQPAPDGDTYSDFRLSGLRWQERFSPWSGGELLAGIDLDRMSGEARFARVAPAPASRFEAPDFRIDSPYLALSQRMALDEDWLLQPSAGVRHYRHSDFGSETAPQAGLALISKRLTLFANASRGVNYPGLETPLLASLIPPLGQSWKQLDAERLDHAEVGFKFSPDAATQLDLSLFQDEVKNRYVFGFPPEVPPPPQFINLGAYRMHGVELSLRQALGTDWTLFAGLTLLDPSIDHLPYSPRRSATLGLNGQLGGLRLAFDAQYQSEVWALNRARRQARSTPSRWPASPSPTSASPTRWRRWAARASCSSTWRTCSTAATATGRATRCRDGGAAGPGGRLLASCSARRLGPASAPACAARPPGPACDHLPQEATAAMG
ncbi:TonB-dependent receptor plug domain-containing protein [Chitinimonas koreensis]|uniref:TonB-dependent receptor plug domain-containing protein n=1 Tax=Chitinimonas koreensis TaxID=356302 RepID=UPI0022406E74|nr:TonB-dependent receptor [Chitinimonas koreensis]